MISNKPDTLGLTENRTLECDFHAIEDSPSPLRNEYYQLAESCGHFQLLPQTHGILAEHHNQNRGCSGGTDICGFGMAEYKEDNEHIEPNLSSSLMNLAKRESHILCDSPNDPEKCSPNASSRSRRSEDVIVMTT